MLDKLPENVRLYGFTNSSNNCYINSVIQSLFNISEFKKNFQTNKKNHCYNENLLMNAFILLVDHMEESNNKATIIEAKKLLSAIKKTNQLFNNDNHHDAHEFLIWLIDYLHETYLQSVNNSKKENFLTISPFSSLFMGSQVSQTKCLNCELIYNRKETFINIGIDIDNNVSLTSCLKKYTRKEYMKNNDKVYCENCNNHLEAERK